MRRRLPGAVEFVYDNWNGLVFGFGPTERPSEAILSLLLMPRWVTLCFLKGATLPDSDKLLKGGGRIVRSRRLASPKDLDEPGLRALVDLAIERSEPPMPARGGSTGIRSVSAKQRPRRP